MAFQPIDSLLSLSNSVCWRRFSMASMNPGKTAPCCIILVILCAASANTVYGPTNGEVTLKPGVAGIIEDILWKHKGNKMVEWDLTAGAETTEFLRFKGRTKLNTKTGDVTIIRLAKEDSGLYEGEFQIAGLLRLTPCELKVLDPVTEANVTCETSDGMSTLHCTAAGESLTYSWSGPGLPTAGMSGQTGPQISQENQDSVYTCNVSNPVSHSSLSFHARDCFGSGNLPMIIGISCAVVAVIIIGAAVIFYKLQRSRSESHVYTECPADSEDKRGVDEKTDAQWESCTPKISSNSVDSKPTTYSCEKESDGDQHPPTSVRKKIGFFENKEKSKNSSSPAYRGHSGNPNDDKQGFREICETEPFNNENNDQNSDFSGGQSGSFEDTSAGDGDISAKTGTVKEAGEPEKGEDTKRDARGDTEGEAGNTEGAGNAKQEDGEIKEDGEDIKEQDIGTNGAGATKGTGATKGGNGDTQEGERETKGAEDIKEGTGATHEGAGETKWKEGGTNADEEDDMRRKGGTTGVEGVVDKGDRDTTEREGEATLKEDTMGQGEREMAKRDGGDIKDKGEKGDMQEDGHIEGGAHTEGEERRH